MKTVDQADRQGTWEAACVWAGPPASGLCGPARTALSGGGSGAGRIYLKGAECRI